jgi:alpha-N-arabinofuranosidase
MHTNLTRRGFSLGAGAALFSALTSHKSLLAQSQPQKVEVDLGAEIGVINPYLHSHFAEHLGACIYGGLWVGRNSKIPNINGYRRQAVEWLKQLGVPVLRWPGGCFADEYHWRDGIGPAEKRRKIVNVSWGGVVEDNSFGTHEFIGLCRLIGAEPYLAGNMGSGTPQEMRDWMEYCNQPKGSSLADERAANGSPEPFNVRFWGVGNENWGCGGNMTGAEYATEYRRFSTFLRGFGETRPFLIACGPNQNNQVWTKEFIASVRPRGRGGPPRGGAAPTAPTMGYAMHYYSNGQLEATKFTVEAMQQQLSSFARIEEAILHSADAGHGRPKQVDGFDGG